jgi:hypothetical protein
MWTLMLWIALLGQSDSAAAAVCDHDCLGIVTAAIGWVAEIREIEPHHIVLGHPQSSESTTESFRQGLSLAAARLEVPFLAFQEAVECDDRRPFRQRCLMRSGRVYVRIQRAPEVGASRASITVVHSTYGERGYGRVDRLALVRDGSDWRVVGVETLARGSSH